MSDEQTVLLLGGTGAQVGPSWLGARGSRKAIKGIIALGSRGSA